MTNRVRGLHCSLDGTSYPFGEVHRLSEAGRPLLVDYHLEGMRAQLDRDEIAARPGGFWKWRELLPVSDFDRVPRLGEIDTPLIELAANPGVVVKDEGRLPTGSFKARGLALAVAMARELGLEKLAMPSNGNAGAALAAYATRAGLEALVYCPADTPRINIDETQLAGAEVVEVDGYIDDCGKLLAERAQREGWFDVSTLKEPYRLEGKKTMGLELASQMDWRLPEAIFYPTGGGTGLIGMWKAFAEMRQLGWIEGPLPKMFAVQAAGCAPIVRAFDAGERFAERWENAHTIAAGIRVPKALGDFLILDAVRESGGSAIAVSEDAINASWRELCRTEGLLMCPEGAATHAAWRQAVADGQLDEGAHSVLFNCATGLKYPLQGLA
ncbi:MULTISPECIES: threonine synthase [unclassified Wenzhouxiangella]|uniref:threonine synthase n=1 Tax=unclassified Wenzhouxiangella TaxID=2613841 RepID=UPI000E32C046|nr:MULTISPECIES: threonine synthase [unclassified Wenzhouxiangella]RFF26987.1 threonine synthase [Wenzhouxiangella sp. 15181]RFP69499.1 threonine synthase [Wenzhouxiangella sp. 15190]